ncbi:hypothetical protein J2W34_000734 [Variovorax boronicumulans]|uniref:hypothetical protein n=1 Tax=Variovorax boronicumulans TaxID=436515 RepID=UPI0027894F88|nr:hypothetical protein [Variovorax boronicumulans]MDQ0068960.1 hypothetical protein [Variovorax boronicumulans]
MAATDLVFQGAPLTSGDLVFGDDGSSTVTDAVVSGTIALIRPTLSGRVALGAVASGVIALKRPTLVGEVVYNTDTQRPLVARTAVRFQDALAVEAGIEDSAREGLRLSRTWHGRFQQGIALQLGAHAQFRDATALRAQAGLRFQDGLRVGIGLASRYQDGSQLRAWRSARFRDAAKRDGRPMRVRFQDGTVIRLPGTVRFQDALLLQLGIAQADGDGLLLEVGKTTRFQDAIRPPPGRSGNPEPPKPEPCYIPDARLVFAERWSPNTNLVFVCERHAGPPTVVVPIRRAYIMQNSVTLVRVDTGDVIQASGFSMSLSASSWTWQWSAALSAAALALLRPGSDGLPVDVLATVNGVGFRLCIEKRGRDRRFGSATLSISGRGRAAVLDEPFSPTLNHGSDDPLTIEQLMTKALTVNGVGIGWDLDFGLSNWVVPGGTWTYQGTYIGAILDIANAAGAIVQPHRTEPTLRILPRYPSAPWEWDSLTPDFELPSAVVSVEGIDWQTKPDYNRIFVAGATSDGVLGNVVRSGTAGDLLAPMVTHALMTDAIGARQRGLAELSDTGRQALVSLRLPVLPETGVILPNSLVRYVDPEEGPRLGLVRDTALDWQRPVLRQTLQLETHEGV